MDLHTDILLALDNPGTYCGYGLLGLEQTICSGCAARADEWHSEHKIKHVDGCLTAAGDEARKRLQALALQLQDVVVDSDHALGAAFEAGWRTAANWANRDDLIYDIGSPAYTSDKNAEIARIKKEL